MKRPWAWPLLPVYWAGWRAKEGLRQAGVLRQKRLAWPVVSVGSLSAGGAGKTPVVKMLAELLGRQGVRVDVLSRGYGRRSGAVARVDPERDAARFGDEPLEMARAGLEVYVGADRHAAGLLAEARGGRGVHLLDDGFQHRRLRREINVVLVTLADVKDRLLPAGDLREPWSALRRADVVVLREDEAELIHGAVTGLAEIPCWVVRRTMRLPDNRPLRALAFCGLGRPEEFFANAGAVHTVRFADHHAYTERDVQRLVGEARRCGADGFVTTAKDAVKLSPGMLRSLEAVGPVVVAELRVELMDEAAALALLRPLLERT